ncbi:MAG: hypothetical protein RML36_01435 [Anaerolineae bacterium]|nr:hypothetical protein [Anaerolineae bacterium]MDW8098131.1 hypothetical protein [Anaerolineae bacterium]
MIRAFGLRDSLFVHRLQKRGVRLDMDQAMVCYCSPLWTALATPIPWYVNGVATYILRAQVHGRRLDGFIQVRRRADRSEADLIFLSPDLGEEEAPEIWRRLLQYSYQKACANGIQRLYASLPDGTEELRLLREASFSLYTREEFFRLNCTADSYWPASSEGIRPLREWDSWQLRRLYAQYTPQPVQLAEGALGGEGRPPFLANVDWADAQSYALAEGEDIGGVIQLLTGPAGCLLRLWGDTMDRARMGRLLDWGIAMAMRIAKQPIYLAVRDYQGGLLGLLEERNFEHVGRGARLVKYLVRAERVPVADMVSALEPRAEAISTVSRLGPLVGDLEVEQPLPVCTDEQPAGVMTIN